MAQPTPSQTASPRSKARQPSRKTDLDAADNGEVREPEEIPGRNVKQARGLSKGAGESPNEAGTDQRVEDARKARSAHR